MRWDKYWRDPVAYQDGTVLTLKKQGLCLASKAPSHAVGMQACQGGVAQQWLRQGKHLASLGNPDYCLDDAGLGRDAEYYVLKLGSCTDPSAMKNWYYNDSYQLDSLQWTDLRLVLKDQKVMAGKASVDVSNSHWFWR